MLPRQSTGVHPRGVLAANLTPETIIFSLTVTSFLALTLTLAVTLIITLTIACRFGCR